jgi:O-antigen/teichoic acid export membrane protein
MTPIRGLARRSSGVLLANVGARVAALVSLALATALVAWTGGPAAVGVYALVRVLPGLVGVVMSSGLPGALTYFLAGPAREDRRLPLTIVGMTLAGGVLGTALWSAATPLLGAALFPDLSTSLVLLAGATVLTQLAVATAKSCSQGSDDLPGANLVIINEELLFLPAYGLLWAAGVQGDAATVTALLLADVATFAWAWWRLARRGFFRGALAPSLALARSVAAYGMRGQVGGVMTLLNLRLDFILLQLLAGPAVLGVYAIASKFAELVKVPGMALTYVLYPRFAREGTATAAADARRLMPRATLLTTGVSVALLGAAGVVIPAIYGAAFEPAVVPAQVILLGLALDGLGGVITGFLYGAGRPGLNSWAMAAGLLVTVALDVILIPRYGATGAAAASAVAYVTSTVALVWFYWRVGRAVPARNWEASTMSSADAR